MRVMCGAEHEGEHEAGASMLESGGVEKLVEPIYEAAVAPERWPPFLESLAAEVGASSLYLLVRAPDEGDPGALFAVGTDPAYDEAYREHYWRKDPWRPLAPYLTEGEVECGHRFLAETELVGCEFYEEWMRPQGHHHPFGVLLERLGDRPNAFLSGFRPASEEPFGPREAERVRALVPHLQRALAIHRQLREGEMRRIAMAEALDRVAGGVIVLDQQGRPLDVNRAAEELLARREGLYLDRDGPCATGSAETGELRRLVLEAARSNPRAGSGAGGAVTLPRPSGRPPLLAVVAPIGCESSPLFGRRASAAIFLSDPDLHDRRPPERLRRLYGLTRTEAEVASRIVWGRRLEDVARELGVSVHTARGHLKQIFAKTGTHRQADLVRLLLAGPAALRLD